MNEYTAQDFKKGQPRWCPGCGDHFFLASLHKAMGEVGVAPHDMAVISGIGCSSRLPYYVNTYAMQTIHGRAAAIATGAKVTNPNLTIWQVSGDGDGLAIGGNHFIHAIRRNIDINIILFNNQIYGLTKGQYSPTSKLGAITKTSPYGTIEQPFNPGSLVLGSKGTFFARSLDVDLALNEEIMTAAALHDGTSVVEMLTNCVIFNDGAHRNLSDPATRADRTIVLRHGQKMIFGKDKNKGLVLFNMGLKAVTIGEDGFTIDDVLTHDAHTDNMGIHMMLAEMKGPGLPVAMGVIRDVKDRTYDQRMTEQVNEVTDKSRIHTVYDLLHSGSTWEVK